MNGGRLSDDAAFLLGVRALRNQLGSGTLGGDDTERALGMIAVRYPEDAEELRAWLQAGDSAACGDRLVEIEAQHAADEE